MNNVWAIEIARDRCTAQAARGRVRGLGRSVIPISVLFFTISLMIPVNIYFGETRVSPYRIVLLLTFVPSVLKMCQKNGVVFRWVDFFILCYAIVGGMSLLITGANVSSSGVFILESLGPYFLARAYIRSTEDFISAVRVTFWCIMVTVGFALYENVTGDAIVLRVLGEFMPTLQNVPHEVRLGLDRAQVVFDHPILYGMFCAFAFALVFYAVGANKPMPKRSPFKAGLVAIAAFTSLSSGALVAVGLQSTLIAWDFVTHSIRNRWIWLMIGLGVLGTALELASNRTLTEISINYIALNAHNAWMRLAVNGYALENIYANFWWGIGLHGDWERPAWMTGSVDNFWLATALRYGVPTFGFLFAAALAAFVSITRAVNEDPRVEACRRGLIVSVVGVGVAIITVHLWNSTYCYFMFLLASGLWIPDRTNVAGAHLQLPAGSHPVGNPQRPRIPALLTGEPNRGAISRKVGRLHNSCSGESSL